MGTQRASIDGQGNILVQALGDDMRVEIGLPPCLRLVPVQARLAGAPSEEIDLINPEYQSTSIVGREPDLMFLQDWLTREINIAVTAIVGPGGSGKTRLALEFLQGLPDGWQGGFLTEGEADRFIKQENLNAWSWQKPTLIVNDYAAMLATTLKQWFNQLADHAKPRHPLRLLLLERHADKDSGWYHDLADGRRTERDRDQQFASGTFAE